MSSVDSLKEKLNQTLMSVYHEDPNTFVDARQVLNDALSPIYERLTDLDVENRRLTVMNHFVKGEFARERDKMKRMGDKSKSKPVKDVRHVGVQEPPVDGQEGEAEVINVDNVDLSSDEQENEPCLKPDSFDYAASFARRLEQLPDPRTCSPDPFETVQEIIHTKNLKMKTKPPPEPTLTAPNIPDFILGGAAKESSSDSGSEIERKRQRKKNGRQRKRKNECNH